MPNYDSYNGGGSSDSYEENKELLMTTEAAIEGDLMRAFGTSSQYGQSLGENMENVELVDGVLGYDADKDKFKLFSWLEATGFSPMDMLDRDMEPSVEQADDVIQKTYVGNQKTYDVIAARMAEVEDDGGNVIVEASSKERELSVSEDDFSFGEWEDLGGDRPSMTNVVMWFDGSDEYGPSASSKQMAKMTTSYGDDMVIDEDDLYNWLADTSGDNVIRDDLEGRRVELFKISRESENGNTYHVPILLDANTGAEISPDNSSSSDAEGSRTDSDDMAENDSGGQVESSETYPEPVADFINSVGNIGNMNEERAGKLLDDLIADSENPMTDAHIEESGGREQVLSEAV